MEDPVNPSNIKVFSRWRAYDANGTDLGVVLLSNDRKRQYEAKGYTFRRPVRGT